MIYQDILLSRKWCGRPIISIEPIPFEELQIRGYLTYSKWPGEIEKEPKIEGAILYHPSTNRLFEPPYWDSNGYITDAVDIWNTFEQFSEYIEDNHYGDFDRWVEISPIPARPNHCLYFPIDTSEPEYLSAEEADTRLAEFKNKIK